MNVLERGLSGVVLVVDERGAMRGLFTDGDVRRAILGGASLEDPVDRHMNTRFVHGYASNTHEENVMLLSEYIRHLPVLDSRGRPVDLISWTDMWRLPVTEPSLGGNELKYVSDCIASNWISSQGHYIGQFERMFAEHLGIEHAVATSSGTAALHLALAALGIGPGDEVIVPALTFGACANVVMHCGATPVFADVSERTWTLEPSGLEGLLTERTRAIMPVHLYGHPCDMDPIVDFARENRLHVVEDCAEALGARYRSKPAGTMGEVGCFSFFANKVITTGEGGMVITRDDKLKDRLTMLRDHGMSRSKRYWHELAGFNYRMTNIQAAIGVAQMEKVEEFLANRKATANRYAANLAGIEGITLPPEEEWAVNIFWLYSVLLEEQVLGISAEEMIRRLDAEGIETKPFFYPLHKQPPYPGSRSLPVAERLARQGISLPTGNDVSTGDVDRVCKAFKDILKNVELMERKLG
jgi:perosamine synthetase